MHCPQVTITYSPGAATGGCLRLPSSSASPPACPSVVHPGHPMRPPAAVIVHGGAGPGVGVGAADLASEEERLRVARRIQLALQVPGVGQHELALPAVDACAVVTRLPRRDVVGDAGHDVGLDIDLAHVDGLAQHLHLAGMDVRVVLEDADQVGMEGGRQTGGVGVPEQDVERRRVVAEQVVVNPVVPDQVVRAQPGEDAPISEPSTTPLRLTAALMAL